jgi:DNA-binding response OmpR family regulator
MPDLPKILLIDDNPNEGFLLEDALSSVGLSSMITHYHGLSEVESQLRNQTSTEWFDLILLDYNLPDSSLEDALLKMRLLQTTQQVPIIVLSVISREYDRDRLMNAGVRGILIKPATVGEYTQFAADIQSFLSPKGKKISVEAHAPSRRSTTENFRPVH